MQSALLETRKFRNPPESEKVADVGDVDRTLSSASSDSLTILSTQLREQNGGDTGNRTRTFSVTGKCRYQLTLSPLRIGCTPQTRTETLGINSALSYQLDQSTIVHIQMVERARLERAKVIKTIWVTARGNCRYATTPFLLR